MRNMMRKYKKAQNEIVGFVLIIIIISIIGIGTEINENHAKALPPSIDLVLSPKRIIEAITNIPEITISIKCILPFQVANSPPSSNGKNIATINPKNALTIKNMGPTIDPSPLLIPLCNPREKRNSNALPIANIV